MSDIRFVGEDIHVEGNIHRVTCFDVGLDNVGRRKNNSGKRRALVHDFQDGLTLNWGRDYPGCVSVNGDIKMPHGATVATLFGTVLKCTHHTLQLDHAAHRSGLPVLTKRAAAVRSKAPLTSVAVSVATSQVASAAVIGKLGKRRALMHDTGDGLTVNVDGAYPSGVTIRGTVKLPEALLVKIQDLMKLITDLQSKVAALEARVATLEAAP
jgi:hypothetical protein